MGWVSRCSCVVWLSACGGAVAPAATVAPVPRAAPEPPRVYACGADDEEMEWFLDPEECPEPAREIVRFLERVALLRHEGDRDALVAAYTGGASIVVGRRPRPEPFDRRIDVADLASAEREDDPEPSSGQVGLSWIEVRLEGGEARAEASEILVDGMGEDTEITGLSYRLVRERGEWRIAESRAWPLEWATTDERVVYDDAYWDAADQRVDAARRALAGASDPQRFAAQRELRAALQRALRFAEALPLAVALTESTDVGPPDWQARAWIESALGDSGSARASFERARTVGWSSPEGLLRDALRCLPEGAEPPIVEGEDGLQDSCSFEIVALVRAAPYAAAIVRIVRGAQSSESHALLSADELGWHRGTRIADGPFVGNQTDGVERFEVSEVALRDLLPGGRPELYARYAERRYPSDADPDDAEWVDEEGHLVCRLGARGRCVRIPDRVRTLRTDSARPVEASARVELRPDGTVRVRARRGRHPRIVEGERALGELFDVR